MESRSLTEQGLQFKFLVPSSVVGAVLGRGGATVAAIKRETSAYVQFTRPGTATNSAKDRMMIVAVESQAQLGRAIEMVLEVRGGRMLPRRMCCLPCRSRGGACVWMPLPPPRCCRSWPAAARGGGRRACHAAHRCSPAARRCAAGHRARGRPGQAAHQELRARPPVLPAGAPAWLAMSWRGRLGAGEAGWPPGGAAAHLPRRRRPPTTCRLLPADPAEAPPPPSSRR